jgi:hypothetical protein
MQNKAGHMDASDRIKSLPQTLRGGGRPHMELSRSTWLITSLSPGGGEKMSKHSVSAGDIAALLSRFSELKQNCSKTIDPAPYRKALRETRPDSSHAATTG